MSNSQTRWVSEREPRPRLLATNNRTACIEPSLLVGALDFHQVFHRNYAQIHRVCTAATAPGLVVIVVDSTGVSATANGLQVLRGKPVSRVHALLLRIAGATYLIDTASSNGTWVGGQRVRCLRLREGLKVALPDEHHILRWHDMS